MLLPVYSLLPRYLHFILSILLDAYVAYSLYHIASFVNPQDLEQDWDKSTILVGDSSEAEGVEAGAKSTILVGDSSDATILSQTSMKRAPDEPAATLRQRNKTPSSSSSARKDIASSQQAVEKKDSDSNFAIPPIDSVSPWLVALLYFLNPLSIMSCVSNSTTVWSFAALTGSLHHACRGMLHIFIIAVIVICDQ